MRDDCPITRNIIARQERVFLAAEKRGITLADLSVSTEIPKTTLESYRSKPSRSASVMSLASFVKLAKALPKDLAELLIEDSGYDLSPKNAREKDWLALGERAAALASKVCRYQSTGGFIDHQEDADLTDEMRAFAADAQAMVHG